VFVVGDHRIPWADLGEACVGAELTITSPIEGGYPPVREAIDEDEALRWADAIELLGQCLPRSVRGTCPVDDLTNACRLARAAAVDAKDTWELIAEVAGWTDAPPSDDEDLWTGAAMALVSVAAESLDPDVAAALDSLEINDWLAAVIELVRCGPGTLADAESLVALAARCLDVDSAAVDPGSGPTLATAFGAIVPIWRALGAVDASGGLTALGAWGIPVALARAWAGELP
jgi:hypothetical protein